MINIQKTDSIVQLYIDKLILCSDPLYPLWNRENFLFSKPGKWNYIDGCMIKAVIMLYELTANEKLLEYAKQFIDCYINNNGKIPSMNPLDYNLDNINGGKNLIYLYKKTKDEKYLLAFEMLYASQLKTQPRLNCGNFFHKAVYPFQVWLDGAYMALPFLTEYAILSNNSETTKDVCKQLRNINQLMRDAKTGLYFHGYDETHNMFWADKSTGLSGEFWLRAMGWYCAALADICELAEKNSELFCVCRDTLIELLNSLSEYITADNMLLHLPARTKLNGNYPETSGTLLFSYASLKAFRLGFGIEKNKTDGIKTLSAVTENYIYIGDKGVPVLKNICLVAGLGGASHRDGSAEYYLSEPVVENDAKGIAPYLMAYTELKHITAQ